MKHYKMKYVNFTESGSTHVKINPVDMIRSVRFDYDKIVIFRGVDYQNLLYQDFQDILNLKENHEFNAKTQKDVLVFLSKIWEHIYCQFLESDDVHLNFFKEMKNEIKNTKSDFLKAS